MSKLECGPQFNQKVQHYFDLLQDDTKVLLSPLRGLGYYRVSEENKWGRVFPAQVATIESIRTEGQTVVNVRMWEVILRTLAENEQMTTFNLTDCSGFAFRMKDTSYPASDVFMGAHIPVNHGVAFEDLIKIIERRNYNVRDILISAQEREVPYLEDQIANHFPDARVHIDPRGYYDFGGLILASSIGALLREVQTDRGVTYIPIQCWEW
ncbi:hypothetical protein HYS94_01120 [Candidatus Daviesbacteria bacterium]|nr:hypothetical protein [Candidatus Daviesbacteria bacterium]